MVLGGTLQGAHGELEGGRAATLGLHWLCRQRAILLPWESTRPRRMMPFPLPKAPASQGLSV